MTLPFTDNSDLPLVLIGGTLCNARLWQPLIAHLNVSSVVCLTLSCGESATTCARRLLAVLPPRFMLVGFSLGAIVALQIAADAPARLAGLALLSVNPLADRPENAGSRRAAVRAAEEQGHASWLSTTLWHQYVAHASLGNRRLHDLLCRMAEETPTETFARQTEIAISRRDNRRALGILTCPVMIINGAEDAICTPEHHRLAATGAANPAWITLEATGHFFVLEAAERTADVLHPWIKESLNAHQHP